MKKTTTTRTQKTVQAQKTAPATKSQSTRSYNPWSFSIYVYWVIILFFIAATFYILGRSHGVLNHRVPLNNSANISEETLMQASDYYESGKTKLLSGNAADAIVDLTTAIDAGNPTVDMHVLRGEAYLQTANYADALDDFNAALDLNPTSSVAYYDRALLNMRMENYDAALADINNALAARATTDEDILQLRDLYAKRGQLNLWLKNWDGAIADYTNSLARPDGIVNPSVYAERAEAYTAVGDYAAAIADYSAAVRVISEQIQGVPTSGERESMSSNAMSYFEKSAALNLRLGNTNAALSDLDSARTIAVALNDSETIGRLDALIEELQQQ